MKSVGKIENLDRKVIAFSSIFYAFRVNLLKMFDFGISSIKNA